MKPIPRLLLVAIAIASIATSCLHATTTIHFIGGSPDDNNANPDILAYDKNIGDFSNRFTLGTGITTATSSLFTGTVNDVDFSYNIRLTALGTTAYLDNRGSYLRPANSEFDNSQGVLVDIINLSETGGANSAGFDVVFDSYAGFSTSRTVNGSLMAFTPTNAGASNKDSTLSFDRVSGDGVDTITLSTDDSTTFAEWTAGATSMEIYGGTGSNSAELRNLFLNFKTVAVPEPGSYALLAGMLGITSVMLRRRE